MPDGILLIDKPAGPSSAQAIAPLKRRFKGSRVGHAGTLDPFASGLLVVLVGDATRLQDLAMALPKTYVATVRFGVETDTLDPLGAVVLERDPGPRPETLEAAAQAFLGEIDQMPPVFSALKVEGQRAYKLAREGKEVELKARRVRVHSLTVHEVRWPDATIELATGSGFYVRSFARDLGRALGLPAHLAALRRTRIGPFAAAGAKGVDGPDLLDPLALVEAAGIPVVEAPRTAAQAFAQGRGAPAGVAGRVAIVCEGRLVGLGKEGGAGAVILSAARRALGC
ncbi:MAG TPA: tRNA pseudouridine(55) synthase TruB [Planctomycetota bacterium]|nr:tRNA pseudouridine(55) synthase TruB [Planctomycetota bacterium]